MPQRDIVVIGTSAGGVEALREIVGGLPADLPATLLVVIHVPPESPGLMPQILNRAGRLPAAHGADGEPLQRGRIYVAPPGAHMMVDGGRVRLARGPRENLHRPAVDPLFRSAAAAFGPRVIGVVLTGALDDGTAGLAAVKRCGGVAVVQDPHDATFPSMPESALRNVSVDHCVALAEMPALLTRLVGEPVPGKGEEPPREVRMEIGMAAMDSSQDKLDQIGTRSTFTCPECNGTLWQINETDVLRFRCHVGHAYAAETLLSQQGTRLEDALWAALRSFEENAALATKMAQRSREQGQDTVEARFLRRAETAHARANEIRGLLERIDALTKPA